jgi:hypothetical protein
LASIVSLQNSLSAGELSPSLFGRTDLEKYHSGTSTCRNFFVNYRGGVLSRAGLAYVGTCKQQYPVPPRDIPFQFSLNQGYVLEFGDYYLRIKSNGAYVIEPTKSVTTVSAAGLFTVASHGYSVGDWIYDTGNTGFSGLTWIVNTTPTANTFTVTDLFGNVITSATASTGGTVARIYTVVAPYAAVDLPYLKYTQSADVMTLTCVNTSTNTEYPPYSLERLDNTNWVFTQETFVAAISAPTNVSAVARSSDTPSTWYSYVVTAIDATTGEESIASSIASVQNNDISISAGSNTITWSDVIGASSYNVYAAPASYQVGVPVSSVFGFVGSALGPSFTDDNITPDFTKVPPVHNDPFAIGAITDISVTNEGGNYDQTTISYHITTSTGTGFAGTPIVGNGQVLGFNITNPGSNYRDTDTIAFSDSGGGLATGYFQGGTNPSDGNSVIMNGVTIKFRRSSTAPGYNETPLGNTLALTMQSLCNFCNASNDISLSCATYTCDATHLYVTYKTPGTVGNAYTLNADSSGFSTSGATLTGGGTVGSGATATLHVGPLSGTYPSVPAYFQQRRVYANSLNEPDTYWMSRPGLFNNMDSSTPVTSGDSITGTPWAQQVNGIQFLVPMPGGLVVLTGKGAWQVNGGQNAAITPSNQNAVPQAYNGCHDTVTPITINYDILYVQSKGSIARDLAYNFFTNIYTGTDLTVLSNHLFINRQIIQWAWAEEPYKTIWVVMSDGQMLCLTYLKEQDVYAWTRHDTNGLFVSVCSVTEPPVDAVYVITQRYVQGAWRYYSERMNNRVWNKAEDSFCVDSGLSTALSYPDATLSASSSLLGTTSTFSASASVFSNADVGKILRIGGGKATITHYTSPTQIEGTITEPITNVILDDPNLMPVPASSGNWSLSSNVTTVSGLNHLEGLTVSVLADGSVSSSQVVTNGVISLDYPASLIVVGLPYVCQVQTLYVDHPDQGNTVQNRRKTISSVGLRLEATRGLTVGADQPDASTQQNYATIPWTDMQEIKERTQFDLAGTAAPLYTGDYYKNITSGWTVKGQVALQQTYPLPASVLALILYWTLGDDK